MLWTIILTVVSIYLTIKLLTHVTNAKCKSKVCLVGKIAIITGGNSGLGLELAKVLASKGCTVVIADYEDCTETVKQIIEETHNPNVTAKHVDFRSFKSVRLFADDIARNYHSIHILVNNAGISDMTCQTTEDGLQKIMQVNYFSHFLLTHLLAGKLVESSPSRIIFTSSLAAYATDLTLDNLKSKSPELNKMLDCGAYGNSKLALAIFSRKLAEKLKNTGVTSNCFHPGIVKTKIWKRMNELGSAFITFYVLLAYTVLFGKNTEEGIQTMLHLCCCDDVKNISGKFFIECKPFWQPKPVRDKTFCNDIWNLSENLVGLKPDEKIDCVVKKLKT